MTRKQNETQPDTTIALEAGKFCLDIAKLVFGGVILAGVMQQGIEFNSLFLTGTGVVLLFVVFGFYLIKKSKQISRR
ncbi:MAG: ABC transporter permease [Prevotella sp.]|nr:ABC transporter permease [Prevotella sp.]